MDTQAHNPSELFLANSRKATITEKRMVLEAMRQLHTDGIRRPHCEEITGWLVKQGAINAVSNRVKTILMNLRKTGKVEARRHAGWWLKERITPPQSPSFDFGGVPVKAGDGIQSTEKRFLGLAALKENVQIGHVVAVYVDPTTGIMDVHLATPQDLACFKQ